MKKITEHTMRVTERKQEEDRRHCEQVPIGHQAFRET